MDINCANCERPLGRLEQPKDWGGSLVCPACYRLLADALSEEISEVPAPGTDSRHDRNKNSPSRKRTTPLVLLVISFTCLVYFGAMFLANRPTRLNDRDSRLIEAFIHEANAFGGLVGTHSLGRLETALRDLDLMDSKSNDAAMLHHAASTYCHAMWRYYNSDIPDAEGTRLLDVAYDAKRQLEEGYQALRSRSTPQWRPLGEVYPQQTQPATGRQP